MHGADGIDELSPTGPNLVCEVVDGSVRERTIDPRELGIERCGPDELARRLAGRERGADPARLRGRAERPAKRDPAERGGRDRRGGHADDLREGLELAREAIDSGAATAASTS